MKTEEQIKERIKRIEEDDRYQSGLKCPATVEINAPLALIQVSLEARMSVLKWILREE